MAPDKHFPLVRAVSESGSAVPITDRPIVRWQLAAGMRPSGVWISRSGFATS
jgi:hypothetical protein